MKSYLILICLIFLNINTNGNCNHPDDFLALKQLYFSTNGENWFNSTNWDIVDEYSGPQPDTDLSLMYGVSCDNNGRVTQIYLPNNNLSGSLNQNIGYLGVVKTINLSNNNIGGSIPSEICFCGEVENLNLRNNNFSGEIPSGLANTTSLVYLDLSFNQLSGIIPSSLSGLSNLKDLKLNYNNLEGGLIANFFNMPSLEKLYLSDNNISGYFPTFQIEPIISKLESILVQNNQITGYLPNDVEQLINLKYLNVNDNNLTGSIPEELCGLTELKSIQLFNNQITGRIPACLVDLTDLYSLMLANNNLEGCIPYQFDSFCANGVSVNIANNPNLYNDDIYSFCSSQIGTCYIGDECSDPHILDNIPSSLTSQSTCLLHDDYFIDDLNCNSVSNVLEGKEGIYLLELETDQCLDIEVTTTNTNFSMLLSHTCPSEISNQECNNMVNLQNSDGHTFNSIWMPVDSMNYLSISGMNNPDGNCINYDLSIYKSTNPLLNNWNENINSTWYADAANWNLGSFPGNCEEVKVNAGSNLSLLAGETVSINNLTIEQGAEFTVEQGAELIVLPK